MQVREQRMSQIRGAVLPALCCVWRIILLPLSQLWTDWVIILAVYFLLRGFLKSLRAWPAITLVTVTLLLGVYVFGQLPYTLVVLGRSP
jgi:hypothetical protein